MKTNRFQLRHGLHRKLALVASLALSLPLALLAQTTILFEGFEGAFPGDNAWSVGDANLNGPTAHWDDVNLDFGGEGAHAGNWKGYCAGYGYGGTIPAPTYQNNMTVFMERAINLTGLSSATLRFWHKLPGIEDNFDQVRVFVGGNLAWYASTEVPDWTEVVLDLGAHLGTSPVLRFEFYSDVDVTEEGWYLDDILVTGVSPPANDSCVNALPLTDGVPYTMDTAGATDDTFVPDCQSNFGRGVWFTFSPIADRVDISTCGSSFDTVLQVFSGGDTTCEFMTRVACNDDHGPSCSGSAASVQFTATANTLYRILAGGWSAQTGTLTITARWQDTIPPTITCPNNVTAQRLSDAPPRPTTISQFLTQGGQLNDNFSTNLIYGSSDGSWVGGPCGGTIARTHTVTDEAMNSASCVQVITILDTIPPIIVCPANFSVQCVSEVPPRPTTLAEFALAGGSAYDNCDTNLLYVCTDGPLVGGACGGTIRRTHTVMDDCTNSASCVQIITVQDTTPPVISCGPSQTLECGTPWTFSVPTAVDFCDGTNVTIRVLSTVTNRFGFCGNAYSATRTWQAFDSCSNESRCDQSFTLSDTTPPQLSFVEDKVVECGSRPWSFDPPRATDNCGSATLAIINTVTNPICPQPGPAGFSAHFNDGQLPPGTVSSGATPPYVGAEGALHLTDAVTYQQGYWTVPLPQTVTLSSLYVRWRMFIGGGGDPIDPLAGADGMSFSVGTNLGTAFLPEEGAPSGLSVCVDTWNNGGEPPRVEVRWQGLFVAAAGGSKAEFRQHRFVDASVEVKPTGQVIIRLEGWGMMGTWIPNYTGLTVNQYVFAARTGAAVDNHWIDDVCINGDPSAFAMTRTWQATDACGNTAQRSQTVTVHDTMPPTITCAPNQQIDTGTPLIFTPPTFTDGCDGTNLTLRVVSTVTNWGTPPCAYNVTRTWEVVDTAGLASSCSQTIFVRDPIPPTIACPSNLTVQCFADVPPWPTSLAELVAQGGYASDNCDGDLTYSRSESRVTNGCSVTLYRTHTVTDDSTNSASCVQIITVQDITPAVITASPDKTVECGVAWVFDPPTATNDCGAFIFSLEAGQVPAGGSTGTGSGTLTPSGNTFTISASFTGLSGNTTAAHIHGPAGGGTNAAVLYPLALIPSGGPAGAIHQTVALVEGAGGFTIAEQLEQLQSGLWYLNIHTTVHSSGEIRAQIDATALVTIVDTLTNGSPPCAFTATRTWQVTDACGNTAQRSQTVTVSPPTGITIATVPSGLFVSVDGTTYTAPQTFNWPFGSQHTISTPSSQSAGGGTRHVFASWSDGGAPTHTLTASGTAATYTASFTTQHLLTTAASPSDGGAAGPASGYYDAGQVVTLSATANSAFSFTSWTGSGSGSYSGSTIAPSITINGPITETANFSLNTVAVTVQTDLAGCSFAVDGITYHAAQVFDWAPGSEHTLSASSPQTAGGSGTRHVFISWSDGGAQTHTISTPSTATTCTAGFRTQHQLTLTVSPTSSGTASATPSSVDGFYDAGQIVSLSASAASCFEFNSWSGDASGSDNPTNLVLSAPTAVTASFIRTPPRIVCPANLVAEADAGQCAKSNVTWTVTNSDNCPAVTVACEPASGSTFAVGVTTVTCTATDPGVATNTCQFTVTVNGPASLPRLRLSVQGADLVFRWSDTCREFRLESTPWLDAGTFWSSVTNLPARTGLDWQLTLPRPPGGRFYRLVHP
ncbi:MAG: CHRD domain-containing protein [Verrucomicrobia bacterium]|nr:CHRD domain-containing protein [Verrucomicrobiota bacterium]